LRQLDAHDLYRQRLLALNGDTKTEHISPNFDIEELDSIADGNSTAFARVADAFHLLADMLTVRSLFPRCINSELLPAEKHGRLRKRLHATQRKLEFAAIHPLRRHSRRTDDAFVDRFLTCARLVHQGAGTLNKVLLRRAEG